MDPLLSCITIFIDQRQKVHTGLMINIGFYSVQQNEIWAVINVLKDFSQAVNIIDDSAYIIGVAQKSANAVISTGSLF